MGWRTNRRNRCRGAVSTLRISIQWGGLGPIIWGKSMTAQDTLIIHSEAIRKSSATANKWTPSWSGLSCSRSFEMVRLTKRFLRPPFRRDISLARQLIKIRQTHWENVWMYKRKIPWSPRPKRGCSHLSRRLTTSLTVLMRCSFSWGLPTMMLWSFFMYESMLSRVGVSPLAVGWPGRDVSTSQRLQYSSLYLKSFELRPATTHIWEFIICNCRWQSVIDHAAVWVADGNVKSLLRATSSHDWVKDFKRVSRHGNKPTKAEKQNLDMWMYWIMS